MLGGAGNPARGRLLRARAGRGVPGPRAERSGRVLRLPLRADGTGTGWGHGRHLLRVRAGAGTAIDSVGLGDHDSGGRADRSPHTGVTEALHRVLGEPDIGEALELARTACAGLTAPGRPLYAGHAALPWPTDELLALWHAASLLREHRGDGHVATLLQAGLDPVEAIVTGGLMAGTTGFMRTSRGWTDAEWAAGEDRLRERGLLGPDGLTAAGTALRRDLETSTDRAAE